ncbi:hypothetical protein ElyMa_006161600 [Elysia marginata]|uniref:Uncharacterized protein n=1 Tax=Elysia marginata TaxID=1093978 RepID=A0AAV4GZL3_9GAST|nr:hypothetical protein ElyMa_006161600 [Elysia marginata]
MMMMMMIYNDDDYGDDDVNDNDDDDDNDDKRKVFVRVAKVHNYLELDGPAPTGDCASLSQTSDRERCIYPSPNP